MHVGKKIDYIIYIYTYIIRNKSGNEEFPALIYFTTTYTFILILKLLLKSRF